MKEVTFGESWGFEKLAASEQFISKNVLVSTSRSFGRKIGSPRKLQINLLDHLAY
jgi:hypothetical protein